MKQPKTKKKIKGSYPYPDEANKRKKNAYP